MADLNEVIHQPLRLRIMAALVTLKDGDEVDFTYLCDLLDVTDGNLAPTCASWKRPDTFWSTRFSWSANRAPTSPPPQKDSRSFENMWQP